MNDREQLLEYKRQIETRGGQVPLNQEQMIEAVIWKARLVRLFYEALVKHGFNGQDALYLTAHIQL